MFRVEIIGNLGADAEIKEANGQRFVSLSIAHTETRNNVSETIWISCTLNYCSENLLRFLKRGQKVFATGNAHLRTFKGRDGGYRAGVDLRIDFITLCGSGLTQQQPVQETPKEQETKKQTNKQKEKKDELPF